MTRHAVEHKLQEARCLLLNHEPWYGHASMRMTWRELNRIQTMGVRIVNGGDVECAYNPGFVESLTPMELAGVIQHEINHVVRCHCIRRGDRNATAWNVAADMAVNGHRQNPRIGLWDPDRQQRVIPLNGNIIWIPEGWPPDASTEEFYERIVIDGNPCAGSGQTDDHSIWDESDCSAEELKTVLRGFFSGLNSQGHHAPSHMRDAIESIASPQIDWRSLLRRNLGRALTPHRRRPTVSRPPRRRTGFGLPGVRRRHRCRAVAIIDVSGSISESDLQLFFAELEEICRLRDTRISVLLWDHELQGYIEDYQPGDWKTISLAGGGGTDMIAPFDWLEGNGRVSDCTILLTDGICDWPKPRSTPLVTVIRGESIPHDTPEWGVVILLDETAR